MHELSLEPHVLWQLSIDSDAADRPVFVKTPNQSLSLKHATQLAAPSPIFVGPFQERTSITVKVDHSSGNREEAPQLHRLHPDLERCAGVLNQAGQALAISGDYYDAMNRYRLALSECGSSRSLTEFALLMQGFSALEARQPLVAREAVESLTSKGCHSRYCADLDLLRANLYFQLDDFRGASEEYKKVYSRLLELDSGFEGKLARVACYYGFSLALIGRISEGKELLDKAIELSSKSDFAEVLAQATAFYAGVFAFEKDFRAAEHELRRADQLYRDIGDELSLIENKVNLMTTLYLLGEYRDGVDEGHKALGLLESIEDPGVLPGPIYDRLALLYRLLGDNVRSRRFFELAYDHERSQGREWRAAQISVDLGAQERFDGNVVEALRLHREALEFFNRRSELGRTVRVNHELARDYEAIREFHQALNLVNLALLALPHAPGFAINGDLHATKGRLLRKTDNLKESESVLLTEWQQPQLTVSARLNVGFELLVTLLESGKPSEAIEIGEELVALAHSLGSQLEARRLGLGWSQKTNRIYKKLARLYVDRFLDEKDTAAGKEVVRVLESSRYQPSVALTQQNSATAETRGKLIAIANELALSAPGTRKYEELLTEYHHLSMELERNRPLVGTYTVRSKSYKIPSQDGELRLMFSCLDEGFCIRVSIFGEKLEITPIDASGLTSDIESLVSRVVQKRKTERIEDQLSKVLLRDLDFHDAERITIFAEYPFSNVPFPMLRTSSGDLLARKAVLTTQRRLISSGLRSGGAEYSFDVSLLASPIFADDNRSGWSNTLPELRGTEIEAKVVKETFQGKQQLVLVRENATVKNLLSKHALNARIIHIASHGYFDPDKPGLVGIALSPDETYGGFVPVDELLNYRTNAELVVISGCETGRGQFIPGVGEMSLAQTYLTMGAQKVIATRWPVDDIASSEFMKLFYEALKTKPPDLALQDAMLGMQKKPRRRHPYYWAGYQLSE